MGYYSRHSIFLNDNDKQKLLLIQKLLEEEDVAFDIREETVYLYDGKAVTAPCVSDENWNSGFGFKWYDFEYNMRRVSEKFSKLYPDEVINVYVKTEDGFEIQYEFLDGELRNDIEVVHYYEELEKVSEELNKMSEVDWVPLYQVMDIARHPTILCHYGAYTFIGYNVFELFSDFNKAFEISRSLGHCSRHYENIPGRIKALQILHEELVERRMAGKFLDEPSGRAERREAALGLGPI